MPLLSPPKSARKRGARGRSRVRVEPRFEEEPPSVMSLAPAGYDDDGVYLGPALFGAAQTFPAPSARCMRRRLRRGALKGKVEDGQEAAPERGPEDLPILRRHRDSLPKEGTTRRGDPHVLEVGLVYGNSPQAGVPVQVEEGGRSLSLPRDPNARTSSPSSPLGTLEPPRGLRLLQRLGASSPTEEEPDEILPWPTDEEDESQDVEEAAASPTEKKDADPRLPETAYAPKSVAELEELMLEWSKTPDDCQEGDFCYAKAITAYELIPHRRPEEDAWVVVGRSGLMYCSSQGIEDWVNYKDFFAERELYRKMKSLRWAKRFQVSKCFAHWSENARRAGFAAARNKLEDELFHLKPLTQEALLWLHGFCVDKFQRLSAWEADALGNQPRLLAEYGAMHEMGCERLLAYVATLDQQLESGLRKWCTKMLRPQIEAERQASERSPPDLGQLLGTGGVEDLMVNIAQWRQALARPPTGELFFACGHFPSPWQRYRREVDAEAEEPSGDGESQSVDDLEDEEDEEEEADQKEKNQTMMLPTRAKDMNYDGLTCFEQLILLKVLQPDSVIHAVKGFVAEVLDLSLLEIQPTPILKAMEELQERDGKFRALLLRCEEGLASQCPSISDELKVLVAQRKHTKEGRRAHVARCSPLQGIQHVRDAASEGAFVLITELQLAQQDFLADLELLMEELCLAASREGGSDHGGHGGHVGHGHGGHGGTTLPTHGEAPHSHHAQGFRLVLCTTDATYLPPGIAEVCHKVAMFPPVGVRARLRQLALGTNWERLNLEEPKEVTTWYRTLFSLCLFHAALGERYHRYLCCFQSTAYDIAANWSFKCAVHFLEQETHSQDLISHPPWEALMHWIRTTSHGGHLVDPWHRQQIFAFLERFLGPAAENLRSKLQEEYPEDDEEAELSEAQLQRRRHLCEYLDFQLPQDDQGHPLLGKEAAQRCLEPLPEAPAELFGLHAREDRVFDTQRSNVMLSILKQIRPASETASVAAVELKQHLKVEEMLSELPRDTEKLKEDLARPLKTRSRRSIERSDHQDPFGGDPPIAQVLRQELSSLLQLVAFLRSDLQLLRDMLVSHLELTSEMREVLRCIFINVVPTRWHLKAFPSCRPLQGWFIGLKIRLQWLQAAWAQKGHEPLCHRLELYWRPRQLLLSYLRVASQKENVALEAYSFRHKVLDRIEEEEDVQDRPASGLYCVGIFLYGAGWDRKKSILADCRLDELFYRMPVIHFIPTADFKVNLEKNYAVPFYQAERQSRFTGDGEDSNYITEVFLRSQKSPKEWLLRSVALYCELMV